MTANASGAITGNDGWETLSFGGYARFFNLAVEASGKIVLAGDVPQNGGENVLMRFMADGSFDASFGSAGDDAVHFGQTELHGSLGVDASGNDLLVSAYASQTGHLTLYRFTADGIPDATFGTSGSASTTAPGCEGVADRQRCSSAATKAQSE